MEISVTNGVVRLHMLEYSVCIWNADMYCGMWFLCSGWLLRKQFVCCQVKCFNAPLQPSEVVAVKKVVSEKMAEGVNENGLTLTGFLFLHALFIERGRLETMWTVLRKYGYDDEIKLRDELLLSPPFKRMPDQVITMTSTCFGQLSCLKKFRFRDIWRLTLLGHRVTFDKTGFHNPYATILPYTAPNLSAPSPCY